MDNKPSLIVVTGSIASGKSTLSSIIADKINCPLISRDRLKEGFLNMREQSHYELDKSVDIHLYNLFFEVVELLISNEISIVVEAAFQDKLWRPKLLGLLNKAEIKIIICKTNANHIKSRFVNRLSNNPDRDKFHGDKALLLSTDKFLSMTANYDPVNIECPTLQVDTTENYNPGIEEILDFIKMKKYN